MDSNGTLRKELLTLLGGGEAHMDFDQAVSGFPVEDINRKVPNGSYTMWHLMEHMRIAQWDLLEFVRNPDHVSPEFPDGYWPPPDKIASPADWEKTVRQIRADLKAVEEIVSIPKPICPARSHAKKYSFLREVLLVADHNSFHVGEIVSLRRALNMKPVKEY